MCKQCELSYEYGIIENHDLIKHNFIERNSNWTRADIKVQDGTAITNKEYTIVVNDKHTILYDKNLKEIDYFEHYNLIEKTIEVLQNRVKINYYSTLKETITLKEADAKVPVKKWTAILDRVTCENCRKLNGQIKQEWALFWININGKNYSLKSPPLHWVFKKNGQRVVSCRCSLERTIIRKSDLLRK